MDQAVCIAPWGHYEDEYDYWNQFSWKPEEEATPTPADSTVYMFPGLLNCLIAAACI